MSLFKRKPKKTDSFTTGPMEDRVRSILSDRLGVDVKDAMDEASLVNDLGADSLDEVEVIMAVEEEFNIDIPDEEAEKLLKVKDIFDYLRRNDVQV